MENYMALSLKENECVLFDNDVYTHSRAAYQGTYKAKKICSFWIEEKSSFYGYI